MNLSNPLGFVTSKNRDCSELTLKVCGTSRGPYTNEPAGAMMTVPPPTMGLSVLFIQDDLRP
jgi:hypothetical protein